MNFHKLFLTENDCYKRAQVHDPAGFMLHSTGANNPWLSRVLAPDDGLIGPNVGGQHWNQSMPPDQQKCVHAFIGRLKDGTIATYQTLPWDYAGWHSGTGYLGYAQNANNTGWIGAEMMEDSTNDPVYFAVVYQEAVELAADRCAQYGWDPMTRVKSHSEGNKTGIASPHVDPEHWMRKHGKNMVTFRDAVKKQMIKNQKEAEPMPEVQRYQTIEEVPEQYRSQVEGYIKSGVIGGKPDGLDLDEGMIRGLIYTERLFAKMLKEAFEKAIK